MGPDEPLNKLKRQKRRWRLYCYNSFLALGSIAFLTGLLSLLRLYPFTSDSFFLYLLIILPLSVKRGLYTGLLASFAAFFCFDYFFVPPFYSLIVTKFEDIITLIVFLITATTTSQLASALQRRVNQVMNRENETRILYELVRNTNRAADIQQALQIFTKAVIDVFGPWGIRTCTLFLVDEKGTLIPQPQASTPTESALESLSTQELLISAEVIQQGRTLSMPSLQIEESETDRKATADTSYADASQLHDYAVRFIPLKTEQNVIGIIRLDIEYLEDRPELTHQLFRHEPAELDPNMPFTSHRQPIRERMINQYLPYPTQRKKNRVIQKQNRPTELELFFSTFLEQAVTIIERGRLQHENVRVKVLEQTDALRTALLSSVSHNLRTPLATIKTATTSLLEEGVNWNEEERNSFIGAIEHEADRLNSLVENLLDMSRIEAGALQPEKVWYPLDELILDVVTHMHDQFQERKVNIHIADNLPPVELDPVQIDQVITNLLENATRYTPENTPLDISLWEQPAQMLVRIADQGPGIILEEREKIFEKFYRITPDIVPDNYPRGSGLGLAICKSLIEAHGGTIWVESNEEAGAVFCFTLPLTTPEGKQYE